MVRVQVARFTIWFSPNSVTYIDMWQQCTQKGTGFVIPVVWVIVEQQLFQGI